jgi:peptidoglycan-associated lipoprotein
MLRDPSRSTLCLVTLSIAVTGWSAGCRSAAPRQESPVAHPPALQPTAPAEKVDEGKDFKQAVPSIDALPASPSSRAEILNAQGALKSIHFDFDRSDLRSDAIRTLAGDLTRINQEAGLKVRIEGHCDERGTVEYNLALGDRRARAARDYLISQGVPGARLSTISYGKEKPVDPAHSEAAWAKNRRDDFVFVAD